MICQISKVLTRVAILDVLANVVRACPRKITEITASVNFVPERTPGQGASYLLHLGVNTEPTTELHLDGGLLRRVLMKESN